MLVKNPSLLFQADATCQSDIEAFDARRERSKEILVIVTSFRSGGLFGRNRCFPHVRIYRVRMMNTAVRQEVAVYILVKSSHSPEQSARFRRTEFSRGLVCAILCFVPIQFS